tara:strand:- start:234 stop:494 length:261 start_codon:yes stop_codon:yes gene_type:complete
MKETLYFRLADGSWIGIHAKQAEFEKIIVISRLFGVNSVVVDKWKTNSFPNVDWDNVEIKELEEDETDEDEEDTEEWIVGEKFKTV